MGKRPIQPPSLWIARIVAAPPTPLPAGTPTAQAKRRLVRQSVWASHEEAVAFLRRRLPDTPVPYASCIHPDSSIIGELIPAHVQTRYITTATGAVAFHRDVIPHYRDLVVVTAPSDTWPDLPDDEEEYILDGELILAA